MIDKARNFMNSVNSILADVDFWALDKSCNSSDLSYAQEVLQRLHQAFVNAYGTNCIEGNGDGETMVEFPAVIRGRNTGKMALGLVMLDPDSSGEHWFTYFFTEQGVIPKNPSKLTAAEKEYVNTQFIPYDYWYTPELPGDIHVDFDHAPAVVRDLLASCQDITPAQSEGLSGHAM